MNVLQWGKTLPGRWVRAGRPYGTGLVKWCALGVAMGLLGGAVGSAFHHCVDEATALRTAHPWLLAGLPLAGLAIVGLYALAGYRESHPGTNLVLEGARSGEPEPLRLAPLIFLSTALTHLCGGSSGREGAALQLGGSMGSALGRALHLNREDEKTMILTGMSAVFSALFGTPLAAAVFCIEVTDVGLLAEASLLPCLVSALTAFWTAGRLAVAPTRFAVTAPALLQPQDAVRVLVLAIGCALVSQLFCWAMHTAEHAYRRALPNHALRTAAGGCLVILASLLLHAAGQGWVYNGAGVGVITAAVEQGTTPSALAFVLKIALTALTLGAGYKGGEIVPTFFVGATFGCAIGPLLGLAPGFAAAVGMAACFCGVANCPLASILLSMELFGGQGMPLFALAVAVSFLCSGRCSLYTAQRLAVRKTNEPVNRNMNQTVEGMDDD